MRAILFPGQGAQYVGMGQDFYQSSAAARAVFDTADQILGFSLSSICFQGPEEKLAETDICQPAILTCSAAIVSALEEQHQIRRADFSAAAGLSLGEYTALWFAGVLSLEDAVRLVRIRGEAMQKASDLVPSGMVSLLGATPEIARELCRISAHGEVLIPANFLSPSSIVLSGSLPAIERAEAGAKGMGVRRSIRLKVAGAFHSPLMNPAIAILDQGMKSVKLQSASLPVLSNVTASSHRAETLRSMLQSQVNSPVLWEASVNWLLKSGVREFLEPGPGGVLTGILKQMDRSLSRRNVDRVADLEEPVREGGA